MIADYYLIRRAELNVEDLYRRGGIYEYTNGFNLRALWALGVGIGVALFGLVYPPFYVLYKYAWFVGFVVSAAVYYAHMVRTGEAVKPAPVPAEQPE